MKNYFSTFASWFGFGGYAIGDSKGTQVTSPSASLVDDVRSVGVDGALQISAVWACVELMCNTISTLPLFVYDTTLKGERTLARASKLWALLHDSPNRRMTPSEFWTAMIMNLMLRGNAYARVDRDPNGEAFALWPMSADQIEIDILDNGDLIYKYRIGADLAILAEENVLHIKGMGNGTTGLSRLEYMRASTAEAANSQNAANKLFAKGGKPSGVLMVDNVLNQDQREKIKANFAEMAAGSASRLYVLEATMKYQQLSLTPEDMELLATRQFGVQEIGRWFGIPSILINSTEGNSTLGSSSAEIIDNWYKTKIGPMLVSFQQALAKRVLTAKQRSRQTVEFSPDAILRASLKDRVEIYAKQLQNGMKNKNEVRQYENDPPVEGGEIFTVQSNLIPLNMLGKVKPASGGDGSTIQQ